MQTWALLAQQDPAPCRAASPRAPQSPGAGQRRVLVRRGVSGAVNSGLPSCWLAAEPLNHPSARCIATLPLNPATPHGASFPGSRPLDSRCPEETHAPPAPSRPHGLPRLPATTARASAASSSPPQGLYKLLLLRAGWRELLPRGEMSLFHRWANKLNPLLWHLAVPAAER